MKTSGEDNQDLINKQLLITNTSISVPIKHLKASKGEVTIGSPLTLNEVFIKIETSLNLKNRNFIFSSIDNNLITSFQGINNNKLNSYLFFFYFLKYFPKIDSAESLDVPTYSFYCLTLSQLGDRVQ